MAPRTDSNVKWTFFQALVVAIKPEPAYALLFGVSALFFVFGLGSGVVAVVQKNSQLWLMAFGGLLASLIAAVVVIWRVQAPLPTVVTNAPDSLNRHAATRDQGFDEVLYAIHASVNAALKFKNDTFREAILQECQDLRAKADDWSAGRIRVHRNYNQLLLRFYERAQTSVFSTSIPDYLSTWETPFGEQLMQAHQNSRASVTRVFMFNNRQEITSDMVTILDKQATAGINVLLYFSDESSVLLPTDISKDFTVIDHGEAIGITMSFGGNNLAAEWHIQAQNRKERFEGLCKALLHGSEQFAKFRQWWEKDVSLRQ
jgi:hypothetical protein